MLWQSWLIDAGRIPRSPGGPGIEHFHRSSPARSGPPQDMPPRPVSEPPPRWRNWLILVGLVATSLLLFRPAMGGSTTTNLNFTQFQNDVSGNKIATAQIDPNGAITGTLKSGGKYTSQIPAALQDNQLSSLLQSHHVQIVGIGSSTSVWSVLLSFLPLLLFFGLFY